MYAITVPAREFTSALRAGVGHWRSYDKGDIPIIGSKPLSPFRKWTLMTDWGGGALEVRPNRNRPDLKPKVVARATYSRKGSGLRFELARRLRRQRGGVPVRGGGA